MSLREGTPVVRELKRELKEREEAVWMCCSHTGHGPCT